MHRGASCPRPRFAPGGWKLCRASRPPKPSRCAAPVSRRATICSRSKSQVCRAPGCMPDPGVNGFAMQRTRPSADRKKVNALASYNFAMVRPLPGANPQPQLGKDTHVPSDPKFAANGSAPRKYVPGQPWQVLDSEELYHVKGWGKGYFGTNAAGHVVVRPHTQTDREIDLFEVAEGLKARDLTTPVVVRFSDILSHRLKNIHAAFAQAITENDYKNKYAAVFPIKVNQQRLVVEEVYRYGKEFGFGLEAGSKPELLAVMAMTESTADRLIICNGFNDDSYIEAVTAANKLGRNIIHVVDNFDELGLILKHAHSYGVRPRIGVRVKLFSEGS